MLAKVPPGPLESHPSFPATSSLGRAPGAFNSGFQYPSRVSVFLHLTSTFSLTLLFLPLTFPFYP